MPPPPGLISTVSADNESNQISRELLPGISNETAGAKAPVFFSARIPAGVSFYILKLRLLCFSNG